MTLPLYRNHSAPEKFNTGFNAGLWYDKFCHTWRQEKGFWTLQPGGRDKNKNPKARWIKTVTGTRIGDAGRIGEMVSRQVGLASALRGKVRVFVTAWRFVTGLGREHPVENGFAWHPTLGTPYLPGSSVKGLVRSWVREWVEEADNRTVNRIFGPDKGEKRAGSVIFFDALPLSPVQLEVDVMTPHFSKYYQGEGPPGDWLSPEPIQFLTVAPGQNFLFTLAPRFPEREEFLKDVDVAAGWLESALSTAGAGAKTAAGYGRFARRQEAEKKLVQKQQEREAREREEVRRRAMSPLRREMEDDGYSTDPDVFMEKLTTKWLARMEAEETPPEERAEIARLLAGWYMEYRPGQWRKPNKKNKEKIKKIKKVIAPTTC